MLQARYREGLYLAGRATALVSKPVYVLAANHFFGNAVAAILASAMLVAAALTAVCAVDAHRLYYARFFKAEPGSTAVAFSRFILSTMVVASIGAVACILYFCIAERSFWLALVAAGFFLSEKVADEFLRFCLFHSERALWGALQIVRVVAQSALGGVVILATSQTRFQNHVDDQAGTLLVAALFAGNLLAFLPRIPLAAIRRVTAPNNLAGRPMRDAISLIGRSGQLWLLSLAATFSTYLDRLIVLFSEKQDIAIFTLVVASMSVVQTTVDYFYFSQRRRDFLQGTINFQTIFASRGFRLSLGLSLIAGFILTWINVKLYRGAPEFPLATVLLVAVMQIILSINMLVREIVYWNNQLASALRVECVYLVMVAAIFLTIAATNPDYRWLLTGAAVALMVRLSLFARVSKTRIPIGRRDRAGKATPEPGS